LSDLSSEPKTEKARKRKELGMDMGRLLGVLAREDPELYSAIKEYAEVNNQPVTDTVITIVKKYFLMQRMQQANLSMEQLLVAWDVFKELMKYSIWMYTSLGTMFFSEMTRSFGEIIDQRVQQYIQASAKNTDRYAELKGKLMDMLMAMLEGFIKDVAKMPYKMGGKEVPEELKTKIPVTIEEASNETVGSNNDNKGL